MSEVEFLQKEVGRCYTLIDQLQEKIANQDSELEKQSLVIDYMYNALGPAADDIEEMAWEWAEEQQGS